jgi:hypothetical protein
MNNMLPPTLRAKATERRFANYMSPRSAVQHAIAADAARTRLNRRSVRPLSFSQKMT